jgi:hypothetical protein
VRRPEPSRDLESDVEGGVHRQSAAGETRAQRLTLQALRDQVRGAAVIANVVYRQNIGVIERAGGVRLTLKRAHTLVGVRGMRKKQFDGNVAAESLVARPPHLAHPPCSQPSLDRVGGDPIAS